MATPVYDSLFLPIAEKALGNAFDVLYRKAKLTDEEVIAGLRSTKIAQGFNQGTPTSSRAIRATNSPGRFLNP